MAGSLSAPQHKALLDEALAGTVTYKLLSGINPYSISFDGILFNIYIKNLSSAHFSGSPDVWRAQLPHRKEFDEMKNSLIPFIFLGYDSERDVYATWNPRIVKQRLNAAKYVSLYSRESAQIESENENRFVRRELSNDGEVLVFPREKLSSYLVNIPHYFHEMSDYVAMGSKRRKEANEAYQALTSTNNIPAFAKYLENRNISNVSLYCWWLKFLITKNVISGHRKDFLACDTITQYHDGVVRFMDNCDIKEIDDEAGGCIATILNAYVDFLINHFEVKEETKGNVADKVDARKSDQSANEHIRNGKILKIVENELLDEIRPYLDTEYRSPIPAINILSEYYKNKYDCSAMEWKDWMALINKIDWQNIY